MKPCNFIWRAGARPTAVSQPSWAGRMRIDAKADKNCALPLTKESSTGATASVFTLFPILSHTQAVFLRQQRLPSIYRSLEEWTLQQDCPPHGSSPYPPLLRRQRRAAITQWRDTLQFDGVGWTLPLDAIVPVRLLSRPTVLPFAFERKREAPPPRPLPNNLESLRVVDLKALCLEKGLPVSGVKA